MSFGAGQTVSGAGAIGRNSDRLFNDGVIKADVSGNNITIYNAINGAGTYESFNDSNLHFTGNSSGDYLVNNALVQLDGVRFTVAKDYQGSYFGSGNNFDAHRTVTGGGQVFAADARQVVTGARLSNGVVDFGALRVGGQVGATLSISNAGAQTILRGAVQSNNAPNVLVSNGDFALQPLGTAHTASLTFVGSTAGLVSGQAVDVVNNFDNVADDHFAVHASVYASAVAYLPNRTVDFGTVRKGTTDATGSLTIGNPNGGGDFADLLIPSFGAIPSTISLTSQPIYVLPAAITSATYQLDASTPGFVGGSTSIGFGSHDSALADLPLGPRPIYFTGTVTDPAVAELVQESGAGALSGGGNVYTLNLGAIDAGSAPIATELAVLNAVPDLGFAETLGGSFTLAAEPGFSFSGDGFSDLRPKSIEAGDLLRFDASGLSAGVYQDVLTFNGFSRYRGLDDLTLEPIQLDIEATVSGAPEPESWLLMIAGVGVVGLALRCRN